MFTQIGNTSVGGGYVYQWWLSAMIYYLLIEKKEIHLKGKSDFNSKTKGLLKHLGGSIGPYKIERENIYLEGQGYNPKFKDPFKRYPVFEDVNFLRKYNGGVFYGFIQSKSSINKSYGQISEIYGIFRSFFHNQNFINYKKCSFVISSNVSLSNAIKKYIRTDDINFKLCIIKEILGFSFYDETCQNFILAIESEDRDKINFLLSKYGKISGISFNILYSKVSIILKRTYVFDSISPANIILFIDSIRGTLTKEKIFFNTVYKATRKKRIDIFDNDESLYDEYFDTKFGGNPKIDIIDGGFLLLDS